MIGSGSGSSSQWSYVDDGQHAYLISSAYKTYQGYADTMIMCIQMIAIVCKVTLLDQMDKLYMKHYYSVMETKLMSHPNNANYTIQTFYNGTQAPIAMTGHSPN